MASTNTGHQANTSRRPNSLRSSSMLNVSCTNTETTDKYQIQCS